MGIVFSDNDDWDFVTAFREGGLLHNWKPEPSPYRILEAVRENPDLCNCEPSAQTSAAPWLDLELGIMGAASALLVYAYFKG